MRNLNTADPLYAQWTDSKCKSMNVNPFRGRRVAKATAKDSSRFEFAYWNVEKANHLIYQDVS